ncbi:MAG: FliH/SctL family protein [Planctomycetota bacterium]
MAGVIRRDQVGSANTFSFADLEQQGRAILQCAREQAANILQEAEKKVAELAREKRQAAYQTGLTAGRASGREQAYTEARQTALQEARQQVAALVETLTAALTEFEQSKRGCLAAAESGLIRLALAIARRVCKLEAGSSSASAEANIRGLLDRVQHFSDVELLVCPAEHQLLQEIVPEFVSRTAQCQHFHVLADDTVSRGGCILRTVEGQVDATVEGQLERIAVALRVPPPGDDPPVVNPEPVEDE